MLWDRGGILKLLVTPGFAGIGNVTDCRVRRACADAPETAGFFVDPEHRRAGRTRAGEEFPRPRQPRPGAGEDLVTQPMSKRLFVGNLSFDTSEAELESAFSQWGGANAAIPTNESGR